MLYCPYLRDLWFLPIQLLEAFCAVKHNLRKSDPSGNFRIIASAVFGCTNDDGTHLRQLLTAL